MEEPPGSILIVGAGVFGISTALALTKRQHFNNTKLTLLSPADQDLIASNDTTRIVRADYPDADYCQLAEEAQTQWRGEFGHDGRYSECGLLFTANAVGRPEAYKFLEKTLENIRQVQGDNEKIVTLSDAEAIRESTRCANAGAQSSGDLGYINLNSGFADAGASTKYMRKLVEETGRVDFVDGEASRLLVSEDDSRVTGVALENGTEIKADLTILATGAWTPKLVDTRGIAVARGQCMMYVELSEKEAQDLSALPVHMNLSNCCFCFPPTQDPDGSWNIKVAQHAFGYARPAEIAHALTAGRKLEAIRASLPWFPENLPGLDQGILKTFFETCFPVQGATLDQRKTRTRVCWYLDSPNGHWIVARHPQFQSSLMLATAGSGHAFKFLPTLGEKVVDVLDGTDESMNQGRLTKKWAWPIKQESDEFWCDDASRAGEKGQYLSI